LVWGVFTWRGLGPLVHLNTSLTSDHYVSLLGDHLQPFMDFMYPQMMGYSSRTMQRFIGSKLSRIGSRSILESSDEWCGHHVHPTWTQASIYGTWRIGQLKPKIQHLQIPGSCGQLSRRIGSTSLHGSSVHLWNRCDVELLHFAGLVEVLHDTTFLSMTFGTWNMRVYNIVL
jgi:hypothetical protein